MNEIQIKLFKSVYPGNTRYKDFLPFDEAAYSAKPAGHFRLAAGFSGWYPMGNLYTLIQGIPTRNPGLGQLTRTRSQLLRERLSVDAKVSIATGFPLLYRLVRHNPKAARKYRAVYIGSSKDGNVVGRLMKHVYGLRGGSMSLHRWLFPNALAPVGTRRTQQLNRRLSSIYLHLGFATQQSLARTRFQRDLNYNELFLMEKMLQREERPLVWNPNDRTFDEIGYVRVQ